jgi:hypothetical protein
LPGRNRINRELSRREKRRNFMQRWPIPVLTLAFGLSLFSLSSAQAADSCQPVFDALTKIVTTPSHSYTTTTAANGGKSQTSETIMVQGKKYIRVNGKWMGTPVTTAEVLEQEKETEKNAKASCQLVRTEPVNGESASVYHMQRETPGFKEDSQIWVSKSTGLALRGEQDVDMGGEIGKQHRSARFEYSNIQAPM